MKYNSQYTDEDVIKHILGSSTYIFKCTPMTFEPLSFNDIKTNLNAEAVTKLEGKLSSTMTALSGKSYAKCRIIQGGSDFRRFNALFIGISGSPESFNEDGSTKDLELKFFCLFFGIINKEDAKETSIHFPICIRGGNKKAITLAEDVLKKQLQFSMREIMPNNTFLISLFVTWLLKFENANFKTDNNNLTITASAPNEKKLEVEINLNMIKLQSFWKSLKPGFFESDDALRVWDIIETDLKSISRTNMKYYTDYITKLSFEKSSFVLTRNGQLQLEWKSETHNVFEMVKALLTDIGYLYF